MFDIPEGKSIHWALPIQSGTFSDQAKNLVFKVDLENISEIKL